jgi:hypothetical protein
MKYSRMTVNDDSGGMKEEIITAFLKVLYQYWSGSNKKNHKNPSQVSWSLA